MAKILLHIGLPKTATTTLQTFLFHKLNEKQLINFLGRKGEVGNEGYYSVLADVLNGLMNDDDLDFTDNLSKYIQNINTVLIEDKLNVLSEEGLSISYGHLNILRNLQRIQVVFKNHDVKLLISLRKQEDIIYSFFVEWYKHKLYKDVNNNTIEKYIHNGLKDKTNGHFLMFYYDVVLDECSKLFNRSNIAILLFEDIVKNNNRYHNKLAEILDIDKELIKECLGEHVVNIKQKNTIGYKTDAVTMEKHIDNFILKHKYIRIYLKPFYKGALKKAYLKIYYFLKNVKWFSKRVPFLTKKQKNIISFEFTESNKYIDEKYGLNLKEYDYYQ